MAKSNKQVIDEWRQVIEPKKSTYSVVCNRCGKGIGKTDEIPNIVVCLDCYYQKD
ncbi:hypothetical protein KGR20_21905 [Cytobacillus oceanisediminis]|uniref:hypothetical protein n=1 Tax=Cytobacillus oceanisediminis TaxID=665099 RepID=UPI001CCC383C|nr:hypothetical protein [Cytobacillus oceanisediminis]MBZ9536818.1 hypothetical protein [Cytobacillus oceanisediminis]